VGEDEQDLHWAIHRQSYDPFGNCTINVAQTSGVAINKFIQPKVLLGGGDRNRTDE
jgi:hypothetical protein